MKTYLPVAEKILMIFSVFLFCIANQAVAKRIIIQPLVSVEDAEAVPGGKFRIAPKISASSRYDSNFYKISEDERDVFTWLVQPGIEMEYYTAKSSIILGYSLNAYFYQDGGDVPAGQQDAEEDDYIGHTFNFNARTTPTAKLTLELDDVFYKTREDSKADRFANDTNRDKYYINRLTPSLYYRLNERFGAGAKYRNTITEYSRDTTDEDSVEHRGIFDMTYYFSPISSLTLDYQIWDRNYDVDVSDYTSNQMEMVYRRQAKYLGFEAGAGYHYRTFDDDSRDSTDTFHYHAGISAQMAKSRGELVFEENYNDAVNPDDFYKARRLNLNFGHAFGQYLTAGASGFYQMNEYEDWAQYSGGTEDRSDDLYGMSANIAYKFAQWLKVGLEGGFEDRDSNMGEYDYDNQYIMLKLDSVYDVVRR
ncbi:MAG: outer membrane beta-barrel protein [Desulfococcaceae bacterium]